MNSRRKLLLGLAALAASPGIRAQQGKTLKIIVPFPAGGGTDVLARIVGEKLRGGYAGTVIVENRVGASGRVGVDAVKAADPDGNTLLFVPDFLMTVYPHSFRKLSYDPIADFACVAMVARAGLALCAGSALPDSIKETKQYLEWAKNPKNAFFATTSAGGTPHFVGVMLARDSGVTLSPVHYKGGAPALQDLIAGQIPLSVNPVGEVLPFIKSGKLRVLATTGEKRSKFLPEVPTLVESGFPQIVVEPWLGFFAPAKTPADTVARLAAAIDEGVKAPETVQSFEKFGNEVVPGTPASTTAALKADLARWQPIVKASGFTAED